MFFILPFADGSESTSCEPPEADGEIPVMYRLAVVATARHDDLGFIYQLDGELAEKRRDGLIKHTYHSSPVDPFAPWGISMKIDAIILYDAESSKAV